jgi:hypothetical protein
MMSVEPIQQHKQKHRYNCKEKKNYMAYQQRPPNSTKEDFFPPSSGRFNDGKISGKVAS